MTAALAARRPDLEDPTEVIAAGIDGLRAQIERFVGAGVSKFVVVPLAEPEDWDAELAQVADALLPLQRAASPAAYRVPDRRVRKTRKRSRNQPSGERKV